MERMEVREDCKKNPEGVKRDVEVEEYFIGGVYVQEEEHDEAAQEWIKLARDEPCGWPNKPKELGRDAKGYMKRMITYAVQVAQVEKCRRATLLEWIE